MTIPLICNGPPIENEHECEYTHACEVCCVRGCGECRNFVEIIELGCESVYVCLNCHLKEIDSMELEKSA